MMNLAILYKTAGDLNDVFDSIELFILLGNGAITVLYESWRTKERNWRPKILIETHLL